MTNTVVDLEALQAVSARLLAAADAARDLSRHPGVVRGRAADGGDDALRDAAVHFADRWSWALDRASYDARRIGEPARCGGRHLPSHRARGRRRPRGAARRRAGAMTGPGAAGGPLPPCRLVGAHGVPGDPDRVRRSPPA
ncbi:hypothetical protein GCM10025868_44260 [Angustibacter aerolatus]|uniref:Uncharacterized protein n=1 Tax=Angustibacter aerolatus TaxID=1162965 RepID=A0ABQ6JNP1_9ACTN|nr:hypothetical protein [Angustibacter aerolatus]GMA89176.1 hypothetical protein GCM10025868_44260 [Angustibacter aerolatus]